jgi:hypothetical protein
VVKPAEVAWVAVAVWGREENVYVRAVEKDSHMNVASLVMG